MPFSEPHAAATGNLLPPSTAVLPSPGTIAAPAAALGAGADSSTDWGGAAVPKRQRSSGAKATNAEKARAKRLRVKEQQSANDEELAALRLLCSKQAEELQKLLPPSAMGRGIPHDAAREVQGRLLAGLGQRDGRVLVWSPAGVHTALGDSNRAQHARRLARRLPLHNSSVPRVNRPGGATAHGATR